MLARAEKGLRLLDILGPDLVGRLAELSVTQQTSVKIMERVRFALSSVGFQRLRFGIATGSLGINLPEFREFLLDGIELVTRRVRSIYILILVT
ncbi:hypothetical protein [Microbulbifer sp. TYP-18]|uniref:hypothetical protein n=1 Tax=Microbulbifer sp. TYP-18 TaxID=3230024 RepID=UPI0034C6739B